MGWLIALAVIAVIALFPLGFRAIYRQNNPGFWLLIGPFLFRVYPRSEKKKSKHFDSGEEKRDSMKGGSYQDFLLIFRTVYNLLGDLHRWARVKRLDFKVVLAGEDPADLAINYGRSWAALGALLPGLDSLLLIKKRNVEVECDFIAEETLIYARIDVMLTLARTAHLLFKHGTNIIKQIMELKKLRKGGAQL